MFVISAQDMLTTTAIHHGGVQPPTSVLTPPTRGVAWSLVVAEEAASRVPPVVHTAGTTDTLGIGSTWPTPFPQAQQ